MLWNLLGHAHAATTERCAHLASDPVREAAGMIGATIAAVMSGSDDDEV